MRRTALALLLAGTLAGCGGSARTIPVESLSHLVLQPPDLGKRFSEFYRGKQGHLDNQAPRDDPARYGREGGWIAEGRRPEIRSTGASRIAA